MYILSILCNFLLLISGTKGVFLKSFAEWANFFSDFASYKLRFLQKNIEPRAYFNEYDFIIVGSGSGGCVLANRLSENKNWSVLLIEAGQVETFIQNLPLFAILNSDSSYDWKFKTERQKYGCLGMNNQQCSFPRGKGVGGSSIINYMIYNRGHPNDFDRWEQAGNKGWSFEKIEKFFKRVESKALGDLKKSLFNKQVNVAYNPYKTKIAHTFVNAHKELGMDEIQYNIESRPGVSYLQASTLNGWRHTAYRAFIKDILNRPNLHIMIGTFVTKVLIDPQTKTAFGVEFVRRGEKRALKARKEVILSSGVFNSPKLLILSGIGSKIDLNHLKIPLIQDLPVGKEMRDHYIYFGLTFVMNSTGNSINLHRSLSLTSIAAFAQGQGDISLPGGGEALSFIRTNISSRKYGVPDLEFFELSGGIHSDHGIFVKNYNLKRNIYENVYQPLGDTHFDTMTPAIITFHTKSVGFLKLRDKNPFSSPLIYSNMLKNKDDVETILEGIKFALSLLKTKAFQSLGARIHEIPIPGCDHLHFGSDDYWRCSIRHLTSSVHHQTSTCKMGNLKNDKFAVVDNELRVYGVNRLRIADTSVIPEPTSGHTNAVSFMIGEKAADMIKDTWTNY